MRGLDPRIPIYEATQWLMKRDGRDKPGHDERLDGRDKKNG